MSDGSKTIGLHIIWTTLTTCDFFLQVVDKNTPWEGGLVAVNSFGFGGANAHIILESHKGVRGPTAPGSAVPRLVLASGRTEEAARRLLQLAADHPRDAHLHALLDAVHAQNIPGHAFRGYRLVTEEPQSPPLEEIMVCSVGAPFFASTH